jgi:Na+/proline symporter
VVRDFYQGVFKKDEEVPRERLVVLSRVTVALLVVVSLILGWLAETLVFWLVLFAWAGLGAALGPTSILALYWKGVTRAGVFAGLITGTVTTFVWSLTPQLDALMYELIPAFLLALAATVLVSLWTRPPPNADELMASMK